MEEIIAKKYACALIQHFDTKDLEEIAALFHGASQAFALEKFRDIVHSPYVAREQKKNLLLSLFNNDERLDSFLNLLIENGRLDILPFIGDVIQSHLRMLGNSYRAVLYAPKNLDSDTVSGIVKNLSGRLGVNLDVEQVSAKVDGIRLIVEDLGVEISFLKKRFFENLKSHIVKSI